MTKSEFTFTILKIHELYKKYTYIQDQMKQCIDCAKLSLFY